MKKKGLSEFPDKDKEYKFRATTTGEIIAKEYKRIVFGDHGPYIEFEKEMIEWENVRMDKKRKYMKNRYYDAWYTRDEQVMIYDQKRNVENKPNPPRGRWSVYMNRKKGYADYKIGKYYISPEQVEIEKNIKWKTEQCI